VRNQAYLAAALFACAMAVQAAVIDPRIIITPDAPPPTPVVNATFEIIPVNGGGVFSYINDTGLTWAGIDFDTVLPGDETFTCQAPKLYLGCEATASPLTSFAASSVLSAPLVQWDIGFFNPSPGVTPGQDITIDLNDVGSSGGSWGTSPITALITFAPEPASWVLLGSGIALALAARRRRPI